MRDHGDSDYLRKHLRRTRIIAWLIIAVLAVLVGLLIHGKGSLPGRQPRESEVEWPTAGAFQLRAVVLASRDAARQAGDLVAEATHHATLAHEAELRARALMRAWLRRQDKHTHLFPQAPNVPEWNYRNTAADFFGFMLHAAMATDDDEALARLRRTLDAEAAHSPPGSLCQPVHYRTAKPIREDHDELLFASSEYIKDGLISVYERHGDEQVFARMVAVLDAIVANSRHASPRGMLPSTRSEPNGNLLQVCSRLSYRTDADPAWADLAGRLADAVIEQMLPANHGLPAHYFDFNKNRVLEAKTMLRDHGNELPVGLSEAFALAVHRGRDDARWRERAERWAEPLAAMYEKILAHGFNEEGLLGNELNPATGKLDDPKPSDNWGYVFSGVLLYTEAATALGRIDPARLDAMTRRIEEALRDVMKTDGLAWQGRNPDGYYDALESAIYMAHHFPDARGAIARGLTDWVDRQIEAMFSAQRPHGMAAGIYLDGNFIRTALMYADQKSGGWRVQPWSPGVRVGLARDGEGRAVVVVECDEAYTGRLLPDIARHREWLNLPRDMPRLNSWPEWFTDGQVRSAALELEGQSASIDTPIREGVKLSLPAHGRAVLRMTIDAPGVGR